MSHKILVISTQYPSYGGAATNSYALIKYLKSIGHYVVGIFLEDMPNIEPDPLKIGLCFCFKLSAFVYKIHNMINVYRSIINRCFNGYPDFIIAKNYMAPVISKILYPHIKNIYLISGLCDAIENCDKISASELSLSNHKQSSLEITAFNNTDLIVSNSELTMNILMSTYNEYRDKIYPKIVDTSQYITCLIEHQENIIEQEKYDIIICASSLTRKEKNYIF